MKKVENVPKILIALTYTEEFKRNINIIKKLHKIRFSFLNDKGRTYPKIFNYEIIALILGKK